MAHMSATPMRRDTADGAALVTTPAGAVNEVGRTAMAESMVGVRDENFKAELSNDGEGN